MCGWRYDPACIVRTAGLCFAFVLEVFIMCHPSFHRFRPFLSAALFVIIPLLTGCAVGPDFRTPAAPDVQAYDPQGLPETTVGTDATNGSAQKFIPGGDIPADWWTLFHSDALNRLITKALSANPDLQAAKAALREAEENLYASEGAFFPSVDGNAGMVRQKTSRAGSGTPNGDIPAFTLYNTSVSVSYPLDVFGGIRREVEQLEALKEAQRFELEAAYITLTANIASAAIQEASLRAQLVATQEIIKDERKQLDLLKRQFEVGAVAKAAVLAQESVLAQTLATQPPLEKQLARTRHQISALAGQFPGEDLGASFDLADLRLPGSLPLSLPSQLVEQRPDIQAATAQLHAASANVGVATSNMLPQITLTGSYGLSVAQLASLFSPGSAVWTLGAGLLQPLFHGGELLHKKRASEAAFDRAAAQYRSTVLAAFQNVADVLRALETDAAALKAQTTAERAAADSLKLTREQFNAGAVNYLALLTAEQSLEQARIARVQAEAQRFADTAALFQALGGGWWHKEQKSEIRDQEPEKVSNDDQDLPPANPPTKRNFGRQS
jgi:NodT family efflux transporter outer membrane factor (OMF) lipoprotein